MGKKLFLASVLGLLAGLLVAGLAAAQGVTTPSDNDVNRVAKQLYCPVCENIPLDVCPTKACVDWRELIRDKMSQGWSDEQIKSYFADQYGDRVLGAPPARGLNWLVYVVPPLAILLGVYILFRAFKSWRAKGPEEPAPPLPAAGPNDDYVRRLEEELKKR